MIRLPKARASKRFAIAPPLRDAITVDENTALITGSALICGSLGVAHVTRKARFGAKELRHAYVAIAHELGHLIGARHDDDPSSLMYWAPLGLLEPNGYTFVINRQSIREVKACSR